MKNTEERRFGVGRRSLRPLTSPRFAFFRATEDYGITCFPSARRRNNVGFITRRNNPISRQASLEIRTRTKCRKKERESRGDSREFFSPRVRDKGEAAGKGKSVLHLDCTSQGAKGNRGSGNASKERERDEKLSEP